MDEPTRFAIAYWLIPSAPASDYFHELIQHLASRYDAPVFEPHLTLGVGPDYLKEAARKLAGLSHAPVELRATSIAFTSQFTKTLFLRFRPSAGLAQIGRFRQRGWSFVRIEGGPSVRSAPQPALQKNAERKKGAAREGNPVALYERQVHFRRRHSLSSSGGISRRCCPLATRRYTSPAYGR